MTAGRVANVADTLALHARQRPTHVAVVHGDAHLDYRAFDRAVSQRAAALLGLGVAAGDVVGLALDDGIEHLLMLFAVARAGAVILPIDARWQAFEKQRVVAHFAPVATLVEPGAPIDGTRCIEAGADWRARVEAATPPAAFPDGGRGLVMSLSSGTTGRPKGPLLTHAQLIARFHVQWADLGFGSRARYLNATPIYFGGGRSFCMSTIHAGGTVVLFPPPYATEALAAEVARSGATVLFLVPTLLRRLLEHDAATLAPLRGLQTLICSGAALAPHERTRIRTEICPNFVEYYSSTEGGGVTALTPEDQARRGDSVGRAVYGVEVSIVDGTDRPVPPGTIGAIRYRGPGVADGFHGDPDASREAFRDGWFHPGDLGELDDEGYLFLRGRSKDMIIRGGVNIHPQEIEALLLGHPSVAEAAVVGWPSREFNEEVAAFVVPRGELDEAALVALCRERLAPYKVPRRVFLVDDLPRTSVGKVQKAALVERLEPLP